MEDATLLEGPLKTLLTFLGSPTNALLTGVILGFALLVRQRNEESLTKWVSEGLSDAATILIITGAGGAFGAMIRATPIADYIQSLLEGGAGVSGVTALLILFGISALLKTAQGSSTAALIITSSLALPLLPVLGLDVVSGNIPVGPVLAVMAIGAGAMVVSHVNDSYFWVVSQFSGMNLQTAYRAQTVATLLQGVTALLVTLVLGMLLL
ncbi:GntP family permease [Deinococcus lacus]|uniref:GntP family permease n=1 Tax=Deinococcus lacus TaxID=392561 RepID=A0ABW1YJD9_9DEIO